MDLTIPTRRQFLSSAAGCLAATALGGCGGRRPIRRRPNIILIMADDLGYCDSGCYGGTAARTPNIDRLAAEGLVFTDFHANAPMCSPTRAALLTGRYQQRCGIEGVFGSFTKKPYGMEHSETTFAEILKASGYATGIFGKWHTGQPPEYGPLRQGFDEWRGVYGGADYHSHVNRVGRDNWWHNEELSPEKGYITDLVSRHAVNFIETNRERPFCLYVAHFAVHFPWQGPGGRADFSKGVDNSSTESKYGSRTDRGAAYAEMIESLDRSIGDIVGAVRRLKLTGDTFIFFTSDNGGHELVADNGPLRGYKGSLWEGGIRVPAIAWWPGRIQPGAAAAETAVTMDLFPTIAAIAEASVPVDLSLDGRDLSPVLFNSAALAQRTLFWRYHGQRAVRRGQWKLISRGGFFELYNLDDDIGETNDIVASIPKLAAELAAEYRRWEKDVTSGVTWIRR